MTLEETTAALRSAGCVYADDEAALIHAAAGDTGGTADHREVRRLVAARVSGLPLEQVLGWAGFDGLRLAIEPGVFVPRRRSLLLVEVAAEHAGAIVAGAGAGAGAGASVGAGVGAGVGVGPGRRPVVVDLCCGSGALGAAVLARVPSAEVHGADLDPVAVRCARRNLPAGQVWEGDLYAALPDDLRGRVDVLVVNAPYVPTSAIATLPPEARDHEPRRALDGGLDGLDVHRRVAAGATPWLRRDGVVVLETGRPQATRSTALLGLAGLAAEVVTDDEVDGVAVVARAPSPHR